MAANVLCVIRDGKFKDTAKRLDISENQLEGILHEYFNDPAVVDKETYPSDKFILSKVQGQPFLGDENQVYLWNQKYNQPIQAANVQELNALKEHLEQFFPPESIGVKERQNNTFEVSVKKPVDSTELDSIKKKALTDGTFMKAPNGKDSNLNEQQWLQVRTKAFKAWFGDWEKDSANASKVVDENGEPLVVYHSSLAKDIKAFRNYTNIVISKNEEWIYNKGISDWIRDGYVITDSQKKEYNSGKQITISKPNAIYASSNYAISKDYQRDIFNEEESVYIGETYQLFLNIKDAQIIDANKSDWNKIIYNKRLYSTRDLENIFRGKKDGVIIKNIYDRYSNVLLKNDYNLGTTFIVFNPNQIKSAVNNDGTFTVEDNNIYQEGERQIQNQARDTRLDELIKKEDVSVNDLLSLIDSSSEYSGTLELLRTKGEGLLNGIQVKLIEGNQSGLFDKSRAFYSAENKTIYINTLSNYRGGRADSVIMHEVMHAVTVNRILGNRAYRAEFDRIISEYQKKFFNIRYSKSGLNKEMASHYMEEFIADVWSNIDTINNLKSIKVNTKQTLWDKIKNFFTKIFKGSDGTLMAQASDTIYRLLDQPELARTSGSYYEGETLGETAPQVSPQRMVREGIRPELQSEFDRVTRQNNQINTLLNSDVITSTDISKAADVVSNWISERLTEYQTNPERLFQQFTDIKRTNNWATEEDKQKDIDAVSKLSRKEIVEKIGIDNFLEAARFSVFDNPIITDVETMDKANLFNENFEGLKVYINQLVADNEGFVINTVEEDSVEAPQLQEVENNLISEGTDTTDVDSLNEVTTDRTEHYAIESRTLDTWKTATQAVRDAFKQCYVLDENGKAVVNEYHQHDRINPLEAMQEVLHWIQGSINSNDMITKLKEKEASNPWVSQIISRLEDRTGKEADFRSQFFKSLYKAEQSYYVQIKRNGKVVSIPVNELPALNSVVNIIKADYNIGRHPLFTSSGIDANRLSTIEKYLDDFKKVNDATIFNDIINDDARRDKLVHAIADVSYLLGYAPDIIDVKKALSKDSFDAIVKALGDMDGVFRKNLNKREYNPFKYGDDSIIGYLKSFLTPLTEALEDKTLNSFYTNHKMYQGHVNPSYTTKMMDKLSGDQQTFEKYIMEEFANTEWFVEETGLTMEQLRTTKQSAIRNLTLQKLIAMPEAERQRFVGHKVLLNYQGKEYMRDMTSSQYIMSVLTEFASEKGKSTEEQIPAWYVFPMESNKPSEELFKSFRFIGDNYRQTILRGMRMIFNQELSRIQTVMMRNLEKNDEGFIENLDGKDGNGRKFNFLPWMNDYLEGGSKADSDAGKEIQRKLRGDKEELKRNPIREDIIKNAVNADTEAYFNDVFRKTREKYKENGVYEKLKDIENVGSSERQIDDFLENFVWNHIYAENSFLQFAVSDIAYYKHAEDLQKRLAQLHSPGLVGDRFATDYNGNSVSDGKYRVFYLSDLEHIKANVVDNLRAYFSQREDQIQDPRSKEAYHAFAESFISNYDDFNVTDGQAFTTMTGLRKKSFINGNWSQELESIWEKFRDGKFNTSDLQTASQVKKNFTYTQITKKSNVDGAPIQTLKIGVQHKDSEALLWMAYGIIGDTDTGRPNILRAIMRVMEQSQYKKFVPDESGMGGHWEDSVDADGKPLPVQTGLDTAIFHSGVKTGYMKGVDLNDLLEDPDGEAKAIARLESLFDASSPYGWNPNYVHEIAVEDVAQQLEVPSHLRDHENIWGSQERYIIPSAVETVFDGKPVEYSVKMSDGERKLSAEQFQREYESVASQNIQDSIDELCEELGINEYATSEYDRNYALSRILRREIISSPRYGSDLLIACSIDENTGKFRIPLGDPIQSKRVEQLINSIVKNHINKQLFAGGPAVLVTNWGRTKQLNIRFKDSEGNLLPTKREWEASGNKGSYEDYLKEHQHSVAYYECYASATTQELLRDFMDADGFIDIQSIEMLENGEELLKLIGYRIPTEDMYSIAPFRIVGFLPKECGDTFMQPWEMPAITGEDHDVDKKNLLRKDIRIERNKEYIKEDGKEDYKKLRSAIADKIPSLKTLNGFAKIEAFLNGDRRAETNDELTKAIKKAYVNLKFKVVEPGVKVNDKNEFIADGETYSERKNSRNNHIFNMTWGLLTNRATTEKILNTGTFEPQKNLGYKITAMKEDPNANWSDIDRLTTEQAKKKAFSRKYLPDFLTQTDYYENNSVAGNVLGQAAVQRIAHAILKNNGYGIIMPENYSFSLAGQSFSGFVPIDKEFAYGTNEAIGKTLGNHVGAAADAVKDPVLNLLNINTNTFRTYATMLRLGVPFKIAGLMLSARVMDEVLAEHKKRSINRATRLSTIIEERLADIEKKYHFKDSKLAYEDLSEEELISGLTKSTETDEGAAIAYKILTHWRDFETMTNAAQPLTVGTRYNSISSAVGPQVIDNKMQDYRANQANGESSSYRLVREYETSEGSGEFDYTPVGTMDVLERHPILMEYSKAYSIAETLLKDMPAQSEGFAKVLTFIPSGLKDIVMRDRGYLLDLSDFYQSYLLIKGNVINPDNLNYFVTTFPKEFIMSNFKDKYKGNPFIDAIKPNTRTTKDGKEVLILNIDTSGMKTEQIDKIKLGWAQFHKSEPEMSRKLFEYNFAIAGIGYSPKTFMNCLPTQVKEQIPGYLDTYRRFPEISDEDARRVFDQFVRNNWDENKLVPYIKLEKVHVESGANGLVLTTTNQEFRDLEYFKTNYKGNDVMFKYDSRTDEGSGVDGAKVFRYTFKETKPLGDNNSYLEISDHDIINPLRGGKVISDMKPAGNNSGMVNDATTTPTAKTKTPAEIERDIRDLRNILKAPNGSPIVGEAFYNRVRRGEFANRRVAYQAAQGLVQTLRSKGVNANEGTLMEIVKKFC